MASTPDKLVLSLAMTDAPHRTPRQPKLRSSCDACGAAKLKCDRDQPECGRCFTLGLTCVYGVSRKMGKPPRERLRIGIVSSVSGTTGEHVNNIDMDRSDDKGCGRGIITDPPIDNSIVPGSRLFPGVNKLPLVWGAADGYTNNFMNVDTPDAFHNHLFGHSLPNYTCLQFHDDVLSTDLETEPVSTLGSPELETYPTPMAQTMASSLTQVEESLFFDNTSIRPVDNSSHDCSREAYDIMGRLSFLDSDKARNSDKVRNTVPRPAQSSTTTTTSIAHGVPFDHILSLNRESTQRLGRLLACSCCQCPHLALLYASIISLVLIWYQQAAGCCTQIDSWSPADTMSCHVSLPGSTLSRPPSPWSSTVASMVNTGRANTPTMTGATVLAVAPTQMAMGSFHIDDQQVQTALRIQLLLGEIRRMGGLIDLFASRSSSGVDEFTFSSVDGLYKSVSSWLRREHSRLADSMRSQLKEFST